MAGFLDALKARCDVVQLDNGRDFRRLATASADAVPSWMDLGDGAFETSWAAESDDAAAPRDLVVYGRKLTVPLAKGAAARFDFEQLCETALGPADYITLASSFETFYIDHVPVLLLKHKNEARRLINLIDALCE
jgi:protein AFG1